MNALTHLKNSVDLPLVDRDGTLLVSSKTIAEQLGIEHRSFMRAIEAHLLDIEESFNQVRFEFHDGTPLPQGGTTPPSKTALLTEDQAIFISTLSRNNPQVVAFKARLVQAFSKARKAARELKEQVPLSRKQLALMVIEAEEAMERMQIELEEQAPKVALAEKCLIAQNSQTMLEVAKVLGFGRNKLFALLRDRGILNRNNLPYQQFVDRGYFEVKEHPVEYGDGVVLNYAQTFVTAKGLDYLANTV